MRGRFFGAVLVGATALLAVGSCSGGNGRSGTTARSPDRAPTRSAVILPHAPTEVQLRSALLTVSDIPKGYVVGLRGTSPPKGNGGCKQFNGAAAGPEGKEVLVAFQSSKTAGSVTFLLERLIGSTLNDSRSFFSELVSAIDECREMTITDSTVTIKIKLTSEHFTELAGQTSAWQATGTLSESSSNLKAPLSGEVVFIQDGCVDIEIDNLRVLLPGDTSLTREAAARAVARVGRIRTKVRAC